MFVIIEMRLEVSARQEKCPLELQMCQCHLSSHCWARKLAPAFILLCLVLFLSSCGLGGQHQVQQPDPRLKSFHIQSSRIIILDSQAEVDGTIQNAGHDRYPFDVTVDATFYDRAGNVIGQAEGVAEDILPGMSRAFVLMGQVDSLHYSHMALTLVSLRERRKEPNLPTPPPVSP
jgi:hypothetical protein